MAACGLWPSGPRLVAVVVDGDGHAGPPVIALTDDERWELLTRLDAEHGLDCHLVLPERLLKRDIISRFAVERHHVTLAAPNHLVDAIRHAVALKRAPPTAAMIARLALVPTLRQYLRYVERLDYDSRQLSLL
jgi:hypothetical protein